MIISIDPGFSGGIAWQDGDKRVWADPMPEGMTEIYGYLKSMGPDETFKAIMERTGTYMPGNSGPAAATFARHCGHLEAILYALEIPCEQVSPQNWMKAIGTWPKDKKERKKAIQEAMQRLYPHLKVTLKTSDALGILTYYLKTTK
jgi:hypothetical protein